MKRLALMIIIALIFGIALTNCNKEQTTKEEEIIETLKNTESYYYNTFAGDRKSVV